MKKFFKIVFFLIVMASNSALFAQFDTLFWFAAPEISQSDLYYDRPIYLWLTSATQSSQVTISQPANSSFSPITVSLPPNSTQYVDLSNSIDQIENKPPNLILNYGIKISATNPVHAYYENLSTYCLCNPELFALKGRNALGTHFFIPMQNFYNNATQSNYQPDPYSSFDIVATEDTTIITILPSNNIVGHSANISFTITLNKGQTYSATAASKNASLHLQGSEVTSNKPIAITIKDDLITNGGCADLAGDQLVPVDNIGNEYIVVRGFLNSPYDKIFILGTQNNTQISINGVATTTINARQTYMYSMSSTVNAAYIQSSNPVYVLQLSGYGCEVGYGLIPKIECSGSSSVTFTRSTTYPLYLTLLVPTGSEEDFLLNGVAGAINSTAFSVVPGTSGAWKYAKEPFTLTQIPNGVSTTVSNTTAKFHLGVIHGTAGGGCRFGFFSDFGKYKYEITSNGNHFCVGDTLLLSTISYPNATYNWTGPNGFTSTSQSLQINNLTLSNQGLYVLNGDVGSCIVEPDSISIIIDTVANVSIRSNDTIFCVGDTLFVFSNLNDFNNFYWSFPTNNHFVQDTVYIPVLNNFHDGFYRIFVNNNNCPTSTDSIYIQVQTPPIIQISSNQTNFCIGDTIIMEATSSEDLTMIWTGPNDFNSDISNLKFFPIETNLSGLYILNGFDTVCKIEPDSLLINVYSQPTISISPQNPEICKGESIELMANGGVSYIWNTSAHTESILVSPIIDQVYSVIGADEHNCLDSASVEVMVKPKPFLTISPNPVILTVGEITTLTVTSNLPETNFLWTNGEVTNNIEISPDHSMTMGVEGISDGCSSFIEIHIIVKIPLTDCYIYMPNSFSPDQDGLNDILLPKMFNAEIVSFTIFNRWGQKIFESNRTDYGWDGTFLGQPALEDTYGYRIRYIQADTGELKQIVGSVSLIR